MKKHLTKEAEEIYDKLIIDLTSTDKLSIEQKAIIFQLIFDKITKNFTVLTDGSLTLEREK